VRAHAIYFANVPTGTTADIGVTGYTNGFITTIIINLATIKGSATTSVAGTNTTAGYSNGLTTSPSLTVAANGVIIIDAYGDADNTGTPVTSWTGATLDKDQWDGVSFGVVGSMAHLTVSATVTETGITHSGSPTGWVAAGFQP
jgi:hypothetical protein